MKPASSASYRIRPVEPGLLAAALLPFLDSLDHDSAAIITREAPDGSSECAIDAREAVALLAHGLDTGGETARTLLTRIMALMRLVSRDPSLADVILRRDETGAGLTDDALATAAGLDLFAFSADAVPDFNPREFREALNRPQAAVAGMRPPFDREPE
jgi:hypothetical protein